MTNQIDILSKLKTNISSSVEFSLFIQIFLLATVLPIMLKTFSLSRLMNILTPLIKKPDKSFNTETLKEKIVKYTDYVLSRNFWIYRSTCLKRSLVLYFFLRKFGINVYLCFGVRYCKEPLCDASEKKKLEGHAWLRYEGRIYLEKNDDIPKTYKITYIFPNDKLE